MTNDTLSAIDAEIKDHEAALKALAVRREAAWRAEQNARPLLDRLTFAATSRCECGAGMAYDPASQGDGPFKGPSKWECSNILLFGTFDAEKQAAVKAVMHTGALPFAFYEVKSENQPSAGGATTRPVEEPAA